MMPSISALSGCLRLLVLGPLGALFVRGSTLHQRDSANSESGFLVSDLSLVHFARYSVYNELVVNEIPRSGITGVKITSHRLDGMAKEPIHNILVTLVNRKVTDEITGTSTSTLKCLG